MRGTHGFSTDQPRRRRVTLFGFGAAGVLIADNLGSSIASITGYGIFANVTISFVLASTAVYFVVSRGLWNVWPISEAIGSPPDLSGEWTGHLYTDTDEYDDEDVVAINEHGYGLVKMEATLRIRQSWDRILVELVGPNSTSKSTGATILFDDGPPTLTYNYDNGGDDFHDELDQHAGTTTIEYDSETETLEGTYYTGPKRENYGRLEVERTL
jgi:hypothetical protein